jgi:hypothetical protein
MQIESKNLPYSRRLLVPHFFSPKHTSCARKKFAQFQSFESLDDAGAGGVDVNDDDDDCGYANDD